MAFDTYGSSCVCANNKPISILYSIAANNQTLIVMSILMIILTSVYTFVYSLATFIPNLALCVEDFTIYQEQCYFQ